MMTKWDSTCRSLDTNEGGNQHAMMTKWDSTCRSLDTV